MAKYTKSGPLFLYWTKHVPATDVQDPLGTSLRGSTRLANRLLYCITSITPRARYFAFFPWCVDDYHRRERGSASATSLRNAIVLRERALTLGCVVHHNGVACDGPALVGSRQAIHVLEDLHGDVIDLLKTDLVQNPALDAYFNSLVNLGVFITEEDLPDQEDHEEPTRVTFDTIELSPLGQELALAYDQAVGSIRAVAGAAAPSRRCVVKHLKEWGRYGGLCELTSPTAPDRNLLRDMFFARKGMSGGSHAFRRRSLLLILYIANQLTKYNGLFNVTTFAEGVYFGEVHTEGETLSLECPSELEDIATRWRMFYFHYYMAASLEGVFSWLVTHLRGLGLAGASHAELAALLRSRLVKKDIEVAIECSLVGDYSAESPESVLAAMNVGCDPSTEVGSESLDQLLRSDSTAAEPALEALIRSGQFGDPATGYAVSILLLCVVLGRYKRWEKGLCGKWLASAANDPFLDIIPPIVLGGFEKRFGNWWSTSFGDLASFVLKRFVIQQHQAMSYAKALSGARCLIQVDDGRVFATGEYDNIGIGNARFPSAVQVLVDLALLARDNAGELIITAEGRGFLASELKREVVR